MNILHRIVLVLAACLVTLPALASVSASLDSDHVASGGNVKLRLQYEGSTDSQPDLTPLRSDFDVLGTSSGSNVQIINGHMSSQTQVTVLLSPKHDGTIRIPPLHWGDQQSSELELVVGGNATGARQAAPAQDETSHVFLTATLDQKQPYVQAADVLTVRLYADQPLYQATLDFSPSGDVLVKQIGKDVQSSETRNGRPYRVVERKYLLFPQRSGKLSLDGPVLDAQVPDTSNNDPFGNDPIFGNFFGQMPLANMMNPMRPIRIHAKPIQFSALPRPAGVTGNNWLPAQKVTLEETWRPDGTSIRAGEPLTRHLHIAALGLTGAQLPELGALMMVPDGIKAYPDQSSAGDAMQGDTVLGSRDQDIALIASRPGRFELPALRLNWWDTAHNVQREVMLPARTLDILPAAGGIAASITSPPATVPGKADYPGLDQHAGEPGRGAAFAERTPWMWSSFVLALLWLGTTTAWWFSRRRPTRVQPASIATETQPASISVASAFKSFISACHDNDPHAARKQLLVWAASAWPEHPPAGLNELSRRMGGAELTDGLRELDRACYTGKDWQGDALARMLPKPPQPERAATVRHALPELYP